MPADRNASYTCKRVQPSSPEHPDPVRRSGCDLRTALRGVFGSQPGNRRDEQTRKGQGGAAVGRRDAGGAEDAADDLWIYLFGDGEFGDRGAGGVAGEDAAVASGEGVIPVGETKLRDFVGSEAVTTTLGVLSGKRTASTLPAVKSEASTPGSPRRRQRLLRPPSRPTQEVRGS